FAGDHADCTSGVCKAGTGAVASRLVQPGSALGNCLDAERNLDPHRLRLCEVNNDNQERKNYDQKTQTHPFIWTNTLSALLPLLRSCSTIRHGDCAVGPT